jgi:hypothetical protein
MKKSIKILLGVGAAAALVGGIAAAATSSKGSKSGSPGPISWSFVQGHSYSITITVDPVWAQINPVPPLSVPIVQSAFDKMFGAVFTITGVSQPAPNQIVITLDFTGPSTVVSLPIGTNLPPGTSIQVQDLSAPGE